MNTDTPRTDALEQISEFRISSIIYNLTKFSQKLERELSAARAEVDELKRMEVINKYARSRYKEQRDSLEMALKEIEWSNNSKWQSDRANQALQSLTPKNHE